MSHFEEAFMSGFDGAFAGEKTAEEVEMPVLNRALTNLGLIEDEAPAEEVDMPILKQALENLGLTEEDGADEEEIEASSMLEALAIRHGDAVIAEREKVAALEKEAKKSTFIMGKGTGNIKGKGGTRMERIKAFGSKHKGTFKNLGIGAGGAAVGSAATKLLSKGEKGKKKKGKK
jgi:hypothetical protein